MRIAKKIGVGPHSATPRVGQQMDPSNLQQQKLDQQRKLDLLKRLLEIHKSSLNAMQSLVAMFEILANDITELEPSLSDTGPGRDRNRRSYVRAAFSAIEGLTYGIKQIGAKPCDTLP